MAKKTKYIVINEHTLGYLIPEMPNYVGILKASVLKGSTYNEQSGAVYIKYEIIRNATKKDFDEFRVCLPPDFQLSN